MFNNNLVQVLGEINNITNSIILKYPETVGISEAQDIMLYLDISKIDSDKFPDIGLKDGLSNFLNLFKLFPEDRKADISNNTCVVSSGNTTSSYIFDNIALMDSYNKDSNQFSKTESVPSVANFELTVDDIKKLRSATGIFKDLSEIVFTSRDGDIEISLAATNKFNAKSNTFNILKTANTNKEFSIKIPIDNFKMIPVSDYTIDIKYNSQQNSYRILLKNKTLDCLKILMGVKI